VLIVVSGLPGTGKSAIADALGRALKLPVLSVDPIEAAIWRSGVPPSHETGVAAYEVAATLAEHQVRLGIDAVVDAVSAIEIARDMWRRIAQRTGAELRVIEVICSDETLHRQRLEGRRREIEGFFEPTWEQVLARQAEYEPWLDRRLVLDSVEELAGNVTKALAYVRPPTTASLLT
jgi:predicted kinase